MNYSSSSVRLKKEVRSYFNVAFKTCSTDAHLFPCCLHRQRTGTETYRRVMSTFTDEPLYGCHQNICSRCPPSGQNAVSSVRSAFPPKHDLGSQDTYQLARRVRQEELIFVLQKLQTCRLHDGALWASEHPDPSSSVVSGSPLDVSLPLTQLVRSALLRSPLAHLYELHPLFISLLSLSTTSPSITSAYIPYRGIGHAEKSDAEAFKGLPEGFIVRKIGRSTSTVEAGDVVQLALANLELVGVEIGAGGIL